MKYASIFIICTFLSGCWNLDLRHTIEVHGTQHDTDIVDAAATFIEAKAGCDLWKSVEHVPHVPFDISLDSTTRISHVWFRSTEKIREIINNERVIAYAFKSGNIIMSNEFSDERLMSVAIHELAHTLGLRHETETGLVLSPTAGGKEWVFSDMNLEKLEAACLARDVDF
jgi:predicted Zn-dependent protease